MARVKVKKETDVIKISIRLSKKKREEAKAKITALALSNRDINVKLNVVATLLCVDNYNQAIEELDFIQSQLDELKANVKILNTLSNGKKK